MNINTSNTNPGSANLPSFVYIIGENSIMVYHRTPENVQNALQFGTDADHVFILGMLLDHEAPIRVQLLDPEDQHINNGLLIAGAESLLRNSTVAKLCAAQGQNSLIAMAFRKKKGSYAVRPVGTFDCEGPIPKEVVIATARQLFAHPEFRQKMQPADLDPNSHFYDLVETGCVEAENDLTQPEEDSGQSPLAASLAFESREAVMTFHANAENLRAKLHSVASCTLVNSPGECMVEFQNAHGSVIFVQNVPRSAITEKNARSAARARSLRLLGTSAEPVLPAIPIEGSIWYPRSPRCSTHGEIHSEPARSSAKQQGEPAIMADDPKDIISIGNDHQLIRTTNFFDSAYSREGFIGVSFNAGAVRLLIPPALESDIPDMLRGVTHVEVSMLPSSKIVDGQPCSIWVFEDNSDSPYCLKLSAGQFLDFMPGGYQDRPLTIWKRGDDAPELVATLPSRWKCVKQLDHIP